MPLRTDTPTPRENRIGLARVAIAGLIWGTIPLVLRASDGASVIKVFYRVLFAAVALFLWMLATGRFSEITTLSRSKLLQVAGQGVVLTLNWVLFLSALDLTNVATAELLGYTGPVFVAALAPFVTGERFDIRMMLPLSLSLGGIVVILAPQGLAVAGGSELLGAGLAFASALTYATLLLRSKKILQGISGARPHGRRVHRRQRAAAAVRRRAVLARPGPDDREVLRGAAGARPRPDRVRRRHLPRWTSAYAHRPRRDSDVHRAGGRSGVRGAFLGEALTAWTAIGGAMVVAGGLAVARLTPTAEPALPLEAAGIESDAEIDDSDRAARER